MARNVRQNPRMLSPAALAKQDQDQIGAENHRVAAANYTDEDRDDLAANTLMCSCGWTGDAYDIKVFRAHRKEAGMAVKS